MANIELQGLTKTWPGQAISVDLHIPDGSLTALVGSSGCGKSTVLRMIAGLIRPDCGRILLDDLDIQNLSPSERQIGMVFQDFALFPHLTVLGNVAYGLATRRVGRSEREKIALQFLDLVGLAEIAGRLPHSLSGGEKQRVALARTLVLHPQVVLFDEPLSSLDPALRKRLRTTIRDDQRRLGLTAIYVTHDLEEALAIADQVAVMMNGRILQTADPALLWTRPASAQVVRFMGSGVLLPVQQIRLLPGGQSSNPNPWVVDTAVGQALLIRDNATQPNTRHQPAQYLFFNRSAAHLVRDCQATSVTRCTSTGLVFNARCLRNEFAGDCVDSLMESAQQRFNLRFTPGEAPVAGFEGSFNVSQEALQLVPAELPLT